MKSRWVCLVASIAIVLLVCCAGFAQQTTENGKRWYAASLDGTTGLFKTWDAETLRKGELNLTFGYDLFTRDPGEIHVGNATAGGAFGILDRLEVFGSMDVQRHVTAENIPIYRVLPGKLPKPAQTPINFYQSFTQVAPFIDVPRANGRGDVHLGLKFNILGENRGNPLSLAIAGFTTLPGQENTTGLDRGLSSGAYQGGFALLFSKTAANIIRFHANLGTNFYSDPKVGNVTIAKLANEFIYRTGFEALPYKRVRIIVEAIGTTYYGDYTAGLNTKGDLDAIFGLRVFPKEWISLGAGYQPSFRQQGKAAYNGFVVQGTIGTRRNYPPTVTCSVAKASILQADTTTVRANAVDPDGDKLTYSWSTTGGKITGNGDTATFDATGVAPGKYTVSVTVSDKKHQVSCSVEITVLKRNHPPTARVEPSTFAITQGESQNLRCIGSDPDNDPLTYSWSVNGQPLAAAQPQISFGSEGRKPGNYTATCTVSDGEASASASATGTVRERIKPNQPPIIECQTTTMDVASSGSIDLRAKASDPDGDKLNYDWSATGGSVVGNGDTAAFNASGVKAGSYAVTVTVNDGRGGKASCSMTVNVSERLSVTKDKCGFFALGKYRVDNCAKAILDDLSVRMKNDPKLHANVIGYTDSSRLEKSRKGLGEKRAKAVADYLEKQGVEASRMTITDGGANNPVGDNKNAAGRTLNRRVEIELAVR